MMSTWEKLQLVKNEIFLAVTLEKRSNTGKENVNIDRKIQLDFLGIYMIISMLEYVDKCAMVILNWISR